MGISANLGLQSFFYFCEASAVLKWSAIWDLISGLSSEDFGKNVIVICKIVHSKIIHGKFWQIWRPQKNILHRALQSFVNPFLTLI